MAKEAALGLDGAEAYRRFFQTIQERKQQLTDVLGQLKREGKRLAGFGAPAKATTLMFHFGLGPDTLEYIVDDSPWKQGLYTPGLHLPVVPASYLYGDSTKPDYAVILAWNFAEAVMKNHERFRQGGGHFIVPLPTVEVY